MSRGASRRDWSKEAFEQLYDRAARRMLVYLTRRMHDVDAASELRAECWAVAFESWPRCNAATASEAEAWAFGIARNQLAGYYRSGAIKHRALERLKWTVPQLDSDERAEQPFSSGSSPVCPIQTSPLGWAARSRRPERTYPGDCGVSPQRSTQPIRRDCKELADDPIQWQSPREVSRRRDARSSPDDPDAGPTTGFAPTRYPKSDRSLVRVVNVPAWHAMIAIDPASYQPSPASTQRSEGVDLSMWIGSAPTTPPASYTGTGLRPYSAATVRAHGLALSDPKRGKTIILVPDGVASVTLQPIRLTSPQIASGFQQPPVIQPSDFTSVTAAVHNNVAPFEMKLTVADRHAGSRMTYFFVAVACATWFDRKGHVIRQTTTTDLDLPVTVQGRR